MGSQVMGTIVLACVILYIYFDIKESGINVKQVHYHKTLKEGESHEF